MAKSKCFPYRASVEFGSIDNFSNILEWTVNTFTNDDTRWTFMIGHHKSIYDFRDEADYMIFLLRWGEFIRLD